MAPTGYFQIRGMGLISQSSSSGGGLPGRPGLERVSGRSLFLGEFLGVALGWQPGLLVSA